MIWRPCKHCGKRHNKELRTQYCSKECRDNYWVEKYRAKAKLSKERSDKCISIKRVQCV
jgi:hypothetical protein